MNKAKHPVVCEHTHTHTQHHITRRLQRNLHEEGWCQCVDAEIQGVMEP